MSNAAAVLLAMEGWDQQRWQERFARQLPERTIFRGDQPFDSAAIGYAATWKHRPGMLADLPKLKAIFSLGAGVDHLFNDPSLPDVPILRVVDPDLTERMGEWVVLHVLRYHRQFDRYAAQQTARLWEDDRDQPAAAEVRVGIMGLGVLGQHAARLLRAVGFDVAGWSRAPKTLEGVACFSGEVGLDAFLTRTDILVVLLPLTPDTRGIVDAALLGKLAQDGRLGGPFLLNAGRGGLQVEADIVAALESGNLKAATLDVFNTEPLPKDSPLWAQKGLTVTPHNAAMSAPDAIAALIAKQIRRYEAGEAFEYVVDPRAGY